MVTWIVKYDGGHVTYLCDACGRKHAAARDLRLPREHEAAAQTRVGGGRARNIVTITRAPQTDDWLYAVRCAFCEGPTTDEINHYLQTGD